MIVYGYYCRLIIVAFVLLYCNILLCNCCSEASKPYPCSSLLWWYALSHYTLSLAEKQLWSPSLKAYVYSLYAIGLESQATLYHNAEYSNASTAMVHFKVQWRQNNIAAAGTNPPPPLSFSRNYIYADWLLDRRTALQKPISLLDF